MEFDNVNKNEMIRLGHLTEITIMLLDEPGELSKVLEVLSFLKVNIIEIKHDREDLKKGMSVVYILAETRDLKHREELYIKLKDCGYSHYKH